MSMAMSNAWSDETILGVAWGQKTGDDLALGIDNCFVGVAIDVE